MTQMRRGLRGYGKTEGLLVGFPAMPDAVDGDAMAGIVDREQHSVITDSQPIPFDVRKFLDLRVSRLRSQLLNFVEDEATLRLRDGTKVFLDAAIVNESIHGLDQPSSFQALEEFSVGECAATRPDGSLKCARVVAVLSEAHQLLKVHERQDDGCRLAARIHHDMVWFDVDGHRFFPHNVFTLDGVSQVDRRALTDHRSCSVPDKTRRVNMRERTGKRLRNSQFDIRYLSGLTYLILLVAALGLAMAEASADVRPNEPGQAAARVNHESPVTLVRSYFQAYASGDAEGMLECYMPASRAAIKGMLGYVDSKMREPRLQYEVASLDGDQATVKATGNYLDPQGERKTLETTIKLRMVDNAWYLDDL